MRAQRRSQFPIALAASALAACSNAAKLAPPSREDASLAPPKTVGFYACVTGWFNDGAPKPDWTFRVDGHDEIVPQVTGLNGCTTVRLPVDSDVLVIASHAGFLPEALTMHTEEEYPPKMYPFLGRAFPAVDASPWYGAIAGGGVDAGVDYEQGLIGFLADRAGVSVSDTSKTLGLAGVTASLAPPLAGKWLFIANTQQYGTGTATEEPYGIGVFANNAPVGTYEVTLSHPGSFRCLLDPQRGGAAWPVPGRPNTFRIATRPGTFSLFMAPCELGGASDAGVASGGSSQ